MRLTYFGHACFSVELGGKHVLFDPFIRKNPLAAHIDVDAIQADYILLTHGHFDHVDDAAEIAKRTGATVVANFEVGDWLSKKHGIERGHSMNHGGTFRFEFGRVKYVNAVHSSRMPDGAGGGQPGGFVVESAEGNFYHSGDTALTFDMQLIGQVTRLGFAALCIGDNFTMGIDDAIRAAEFVRCDRVLGIHYDTFPLIRIDREEARRKFAAAGKELLLLPVGSTLEM